MLSYFNFLEQFFEIVQYLLIPQKILKLFQIFSCLFPCYLLQITVFLCLYYFLSYWSNLQMSDDNCFIHWYLRMRCWNTHWKVCVQWWDFSSGKMIWLDKMWRPVSLGYVDIPGKRSFQSPAWSVYLLLFSP